MVRQYGQDVEMRRLVLLVYPSREDGKAPLGGEASSGMSHMTSASSIRHSKAMAMRCLVKDYWESHSICKRSKAFRLIRMRLPDIRIRCKTPRLSHRPIVGTGIGSLAMLRLLKPCRLFILKDFKLSWISQEGHTNAVLEGLSNARAKDVKQHSSKPL